MLEHAAGDPEREVCGLLLGSLRCIEAAAPTANVAESPEDAFELDPQALFAAQRAAREGGAAVIGHYHSHPGGNPAPSAHDREGALDTGRLWVIIADRRATGWRVTAPGQFEAVELALASDGAKRQ